MLCQLTDCLEMDRIFNKEDVVSSLSTLDSYFSSIPIKHVPEPIKVLLAPIADFQQVLRRTNKQITFFGAFKVGKSTFLNAIIGSKLLPSRANRATGVITKIGYAPQPSASVLRRTTDNHIFEERIYFDDLTRFILLDLSETTSKSPDGIEEVIIHIPCSILEHYCTLADTPGLLDNQALTERTFQELEKSDLAVMILSADKLLSETEKDAALRVHELLNGNIVFVVNRLGFVDEEDREAVLDWARTAFQELGNSLVGEPRIFSTESRGALEAKKNGTKQGEAIDGLLEFEQWLEKLINTPVGEKIVILSRLGILESHLAKARGYFQTHQLQMQNSPNFEGEQQTKQDYSSLVKWCDAFQNTIDNIKKEVIA